MATTITAADAGSHVGAYIRLELRHDLGLDMSVYRIAGAALDHGRVQLSLEYCGAAYENWADETPRPAASQWRNADDIVWLLNLPQH